MRTILSLLLLFLGFSTIAVAQNQYYYYFEEKIELVPSESKFILHFASQDEPNQNIARISNNNLFKTAKVEPSPFRSYVILETKEKNMGKAEVLKSLASLSNNVKSISSVYVRVKGGDELLLTHKVLFGPKTPSDLLKIKAILKNKISVDDIKEELGIFSFVVKDEQQVFELANLLQESGYVEYAQPDFYGKPIQFNDPLFENQFYLHNTGQTVTGAECKEDVDIDAPEAWEITKGSSDIRVAIVDDGLVPHEEFIRGNGSSKWVDGFTPLPNDDFPQIPTDGTIWPLVPTPINGQVFQPDVVPHGLACAGLIGASHNDTGIKGIAPEASLLSVNIFIATTEEIIARGLNWSVSENVDVISNSWGFPRPSAVITSAIRNAVNNGRNGKGCVVVFAVGNESGARIGGGKKPVSYPASLDEVIAVGAVNSLGDRANYSNVGKSIDIVAPSSGSRRTLTGSVDAEIHTIDIEGPGGYRPGNYYENFGRTSAACPQVAGVAALMLSIKPELTQQEVKDVLYKTAVDVNTPGWDQETGWGIVNAFNALNFIQQNESTCANGIIDGQETGVDCGGPDCPPCAEGCPSPLQTEVALSINFGRYPQDISWVLMNDDGEEMARSQAYGNALANSTVMEEFCLVEDCYTFSITDNLGGSSTGDMTSYQIMLGEQILAEGDDFNGDTDTKDFCIPSVIIITPDPDTEPPTAPSNLTANNITQTAADLNWDPASDNNGDIKEYRIYLDGLFLTAVQNITMYDLRNLNPDTDYTVEISAVDAADLESVDKVSVTFRTLAVPSGTTRDIFGHFFEDGWNGWTSGGIDATRYRSSRRAPEGEYSIRLRDNSGLASSMTSQEFDLSFYQSVTLTFSFTLYSMETREDFFVLYFDGTDWKVLQQIQSNIDFRNNRTHQDVSISFDRNALNFPSDARFRFLCDASSNGDQVYIDAVRLEGEFLDNNNSSISSTNRNSRVDNLVPQGLLEQVDEIDEGISILPNPTTANLNIKSEEAMNRISLFSIDGRLLLERVADDPHQAQVSLSHLPKGVYMLQVLAGEELITERVVKQ